METWIVGDVHGCFGTLERLAARLPGRRRMVLVGDLVNRGPRSLEVLRWARRQPELTVTLGNHDLHLLARAAGLAKARSDDTLDEVLSAPDRDELLDWLRRQPLLVRADGFVVVHAGVCPSWSPEQAERLADAVAKRLAGHDGQRLLAELVRRRGSGWSCAEDGRGSASALSVLSEIRTVDPAGEPCHSHTGAPEDAPDGCSPWFSLLPAAWRDITVYFGHWAALGFRRRAGAVGLDSGCVYGGALTAVRLEDGVMVQEPLAHDDRDRMRVTAAEQED